MSTRLSLLVASAALAFATTAAFAAPQSAEPTNGKTLSSSQQKMSDCSHSAKGKTGADYKSAVSACMKGDDHASADMKGDDHAPAAKPMTSKEKMAQCSHAAKGKKGDDYKNAVSTCMKSP